MIIKQYYPCFFLEGNDDSINYDVSDSFNVQSYIHTEEDYIYIYE